MFKKRLLLILFIILLSLVPTGCKENDPNNEDILIEFKNKQDELASLVSENKRLILQLLSDSNLESAESSESEDIDFLSLLNMSTNQRNEYIKHYVHSGMGGSELSDYDLYMVALLKNIFQFKDTEERFFTREQIEVDTKLATLDPNISRNLPYYIAIEFKEPIEVIGIECDVLSVYVYQNELYMTLYQDGEVIQGYSINPNYYREMFIKVGDLKRELLDIQCGRGPDC
jgi:hypothetical protein